MSTPVTSLEADFTQFSLEPQKTLLNLNNSLKVSTVAVFSLYSAEHQDFVLARVLLVVPAEVELSLSAFLSLFCVFPCKC